ncbi:HAMP domain-containing sensor histidine kinase [Aeromicrobium sp. REDSEA-S32_B7]|uniref:sensor histidine kinase n=1 Tax=Aeromicrobium sp. REDSEA-S32_B7 TaxID=1811526 RepID=UPI000AB69B36|nr:HAMP domain-containing sensor histidine kinase [Aeromicrobium sp. REDSEA-S32_B7]
MRTPTSPGGPGEIPATPGDGVPRTRSTVVPSEVFAAQFLFLTGLALPVVSALVTSLPVREGSFTAGVVVAGVTALLTAMLGSLGIDRAGSTVVAATLIAVLDVVVCGLLYYATPGAGFAVLAVLPVAWTSIQLPALSRACVLGTALAAVVVVVTVRDLTGEQSWTTAVTTLLNLALLFALTSWAGSRWTARNRSQRRLLESQTRLVGSALDSARTQERTLAEVLDVVDFAVVTLDADGAVTANRAAEALARRVGAPDATEAVLHAPLYRADGTTPLAASEKPLALVRSGQDVEGLLVRLGPPGPAQVPLSVSIRRVTGPRSDRYVFVARDVSKELADAQARDDAVAAVSHEIKTPLTAALGYLELALAEPDLGDEARELVEVALDNTERMLALSRDFLSARSRTPGVPLQLLMEPCRPSELARSAVEGVRPLATERLITVRLDTRTESTIPADPLRLRQVLDNLLTNAVKYNRYDGTIDVVVQDAHRADEALDLPVEDDIASEGAVAVPGVEIVVRDTGRGMTEDELASLFTRFYRTDRARSSGVQGTGLGLSITQDIVRAHGGSVDITSRLEEGTTVTVWLPAAADESVARDVA